MNVVAYPSTYLSVFAGIGGLDLGVRCAVPGARVLGYVEREAFAAAVVAARMADGRLDRAPLWSDVRTFPSHRYRGRVALVVGGFPCQDISVAGQRAGLDGARSGLFFDLLRLADDVGCEYLFLENVAGIYVRPILDGVLGALAEGGWDAEWLSLRASDVGAPHRRDRWFCLARRVEYPEVGCGADESGRAGVGCPLVGAEPGADGGTGCGRSSEGVRKHRGVDAAGAADLRGVGQADARCGTVWQHDGIGRQQEATARTDFPPGPGERERWAAILRDDPTAAPALESEVRRGTDGFPPELDDPLIYRADRLRALGNAVVPLQAAVAFAELWRRLHADGG